MQDSDVSPIDGARSRRNLVSAACQQCRQKRSKCDAERPRCSACVRRDQECMYDTRPGETRMAAIRRENQVLRRRLAEHSITSPSSSQDSSPSTTFSATQSSQEIQAANDLSRSQAVSLISAMANGTDNESTMLLALLRIGHPWEQLAESVASVHLPSDIASRVTQPLSDPMDFSYLPTTANSDADGDDIESLNETVHINTSTDVNGISSDNLRAWSNLRFDRQMWVQEKQAVRDIVRGHAHDPDILHLISTPSSTHNRFGNMTFSDAIRANHWPKWNQEMQQRNIGVPDWAMRTLNHDLCPTDPFDGVLIEMLRSINTGVNPLAICGSHVVLEALKDKTAYENAPLLSRIMVGMVKSIKPDTTGDATDLYAIMWLHWLLWRWVLSPSPQTYREIPEMMRPTRSQFFLKHPRAYDFVLWPALRGHICESLSTDMRWLTPACVTMTCHWPDTAVHALGRSSATGALELTSEAKAYVALSGNWSMGPSVRPFLPNVDMFVPIRSSPPSEESPPYD